MDDTSRPNARDYFINNDPNEEHTSHWMDLVSKPDFATPCVSTFKYAPMTEFWNRLVTVGIKVEVVNYDAEDALPANSKHNTTQLIDTKKHINNSQQNNNNSQKETKSTALNCVTPSSNKSNTNANILSKTNGKEKVYWIATVIEVRGFMAKLRYEGYEEDSSNDFWLFMFSNDVHGVGWCASQGKTLVPPKKILRRLPDWTMYLIKKLTGSRTLPSNFKSLISESLKSNFRPGMKVEVVDKNRVSSVRVATVELTIGGRLLVLYDGAEPEQAGFWTHEKSPLVHPIGWAQFVSHELVATYEYANESLEKVNTRKFGPDDATWDMFELPMNELQSGRFEANMKLEAIDPLNLSSICVATVIKVLRANYLMIGIDGSMCPAGSDWFCYHASSPYIFPTGYCKANNLDLSTPKGNVKDFDWDRYLDETGSKAAPSHLFQKTVPAHGFRVGMMIEAVDLMQSRLVCVATITRIVGRLLRIHFNGWDETFDQWCDCESPDLFPLGWCELVGYPLEPPKSNDSEDSPQLPSDNIGQKRRKSPVKKSTKKKKTSIASASTTSGKTTSTTAPANLKSVNA